MRIINKYLFFLLLACPLLSLGQEKYVLTGKVKIKDGDSYKYQLTFSEKNGKIKGYSETWISQGVPPDKIAIKGKLDKKHKLLTFVELAPDRVNDTALCFMQSVLTWQVKEDKYLFSGVFAGKDNAGKYCGEGALSFSYDKGKDDLFGEDVMTPAMDTNPTQPNKQHVGVAEIMKITDQSDQRITFNADSCLLELWISGKEDGDIISVWLERTPMLKEYTLIREKKRWMLPLHTGENDLVITALNEGATPYNIARVRLTANGTQYEFTSQLKTKKSATIVINKE